MNVFSLMNFVKCLNMDHSLPSWPFKKQGVHFSTTDLHQSLFFFFLLSTSHYVIICRGHLFCCMFVNVQPYVEEEKQGFYVCQLPFIAYGFYVILHGNTSLHHNPISLIVPCNIMLKRSKKFYENWITKLNYIRD
jgi:hypothetical protein